MERLLANGGKGGALFSQDELNTLAEALAGTLAAADLLGRSRLRELVTRRSTSTRKFAESKAENRVKQGGVDDRATFAEFADPVPVLSPEAALDYFRSLIPSLSVSADRYGNDIRRQAFAISGLVEQSLLQDVKDTIAAGIQTGGVADAQTQVQGILDQVGLGAQPWRAERIIRTEFAGAYNNGSWEEFASEAEEFPGWRFSNPNDARSRPAHAANDGKTFPSSVRFEDVRGHGPENEIHCRCTFIPIHKSDWNSLKK